LFHAFEVVALHRTKPAPYTSQTTALHPVEHILVGHPPPPTPRCHPTRHAPLPPLDNTRDYDGTAFGRDPGTRGGLGGTAQKTGWRCPRAHFSHRVELQAQTDPRRRETRGWARPKGCEPRPHRLLSESCLSHLTRHLAPNSLKAFFLPFSKGCGLGSFWVPAPPPTPPSGHMTPKHQNTPARAVLCSLWGAQPPSTPKPPHRTRPPTLRNTPHPFSRAPFPLHVPSFVPRQRPCFPVTGSRRRPCCEASGPSGVRIKFWPISGGLSSRHVSSTLEQDFTSVLLLTPSNTRPVTVL